MNRSGRELRKSRVVATDGPLGSVHDLYFDDGNWLLRYLVVDTGNWLSGRRVLIAPEAIAGSEGEEVRLNIDQETIRNSPEVDEDRPVSKQMQANLATYFGWPHPPLGGLEPFAPPVLVPVEPLPVKEEGDPHLRSMNEVIGYEVYALDRSVGHVEDFEFGGRPVHVQALLLGTSGWPIGVIGRIEPDWIQSIDQEAQVVRLKAFHEEVQRLLKQQEKS